MASVAIILGSVRPGRAGDQVVRWIEDQARQVEGVQTVFFDLRDYDLPLFAEEMPPSMQAPELPEAVRLRANLEANDAVLFVTPEYNHSVPAALKNAIDYLFAEWHDKAAGFVSYGLNGGVRAVEQLRMTLAEVKVACVRSQVALGLFTDFTITDMAEPGTFTPAEHHLSALERMLGELTDWSGALARLREPSPAQG